MSNNQNSNPDAVKTATFEAAAKNDFKAAYEAAGSDIDAVRKALISNLPPDWLPDNYDLIENFSLEQLQLVLCWLSLIWHAGYDAGYAEREKGLPHLRARIQAHIAKQESGQK